MQSILYILHGYCQCIYFLTIFIAQLTLLSLLILVIPKILTFFPMTLTPTLLSPLSPHGLITRYQEQDLLVVDFGLLRAILMIPMILMISLPPPELLSDLSQ